MPDYNGPTILSTKTLDTRKFSYEIDRISNSDNVLRGGIRWIFHLNVMSDRENVVTLSAALRRADPSRFGNMEVRTSKYTGVSYVPAPGMARANIAPLGELRLLLEINEGSEDWIGAGAPTTTPERLLGFPMAGDNLSFEDILELLLNQNAPEEKQPYEPRYTRPGTEIGYVPVPEQLERVAALEDPVWKMTGSDWLAQQLLGNPLPEQASEALQEEKKPKQQQPANKGRVIRTRREENEEEPAPDPKVVRRVIKRR
jgi:hypothetical protein